MDGPVATEQPQPTSLRTEINTAMGKGAERREAAGKRISGFFSRVKQTLTKGVDFAFASPDVATAVGNRAAEFTQEKAEQIKNSVVEAGTRAWENTVDAKDRMVERVQDAGDRVRGRIVDAKDAAREKIVELSKNAAVWGLTNVAAPVEDGLQAIYEIPVSVRELQAKRSDARAEKKEFRAQLEMQKGLARAEALKLKLQRIEDDAINKAASIEGARNSARARAQELKEKAALRRGSALSKFGNFRALAASLLPK